MFWNVKERPMIEGRPKDVGFAPALYQMRYDAPGSPELAVGTMVRLKEVACPDHSAGAPGGAHPGSPAPLYVVLRAGRQRKRVEHLCEGFQYRNISIRCFAIN